MMWGEPEEGVPESLTIGCFWVVTVGVSLSILALAGVGAYALWSYLT